MIGGSGPDLAGLSWAAVIMRLENLDFLSQTLEQIVDFLPWQFNADSVFEIS